MEKIDEPNNRRLEKPECTPNGYYEVMEKCWHHDPLKRPTFQDILVMLGTIVPIQVKATSSSDERGLNNRMLMYKTGDIITVLDSNAYVPFWKGMLSSCKTGLFSPQNTSNLIIDFHQSMVKQQKVMKRKSLLSKVLTKPTAALKIESMQCDIPKKLLEDQEQLLPLTPTSPDQLSPENNRCNTGHFNFSAAINLDVVNKDETKILSHEYHEIRHKNDLEFTIDNLTIDLHRTIRSKFCFYYFSFLIVYVQLYMLYVRTCYIQQI